MSAKINKMTMNRSKVIDKLRKLFALAEDSAASKGEHLQALKMAEALIAKYNIHTVELNNLEYADGSPWIERQEQISDARASIPDWENLLLFAVAEICGVKRCR